MVRPPAIETRGPHFDSSSAPAASAGTSRNEVVIDGESSATDSDEEDVMVITPQSRKRKRKRTSAIMDEDDEEEEEKNGDGDAAGGEWATPQSSKRLLLSRDDARTPPSNALHSTARNMNDEPEDISDDDDDEVEIVQIGSAAKPLDGSASKKNRRLTIEDSDDENESKQQKQPRIAPFFTNRSDITPNRRRSSIGANSGGSSGSGVTPGSSASSRRSSRIERKRLAKESEVPGSRKLNFLSLENCLDPIATPKSKKTQADDGTEEEEDEDDEDDFEEDEAVAKAPTRRRQQQRRSSRETEREVLDASGDDDLDEFIVGDNEVEYMDDDENGVISVESGSEDDEDLDGDGTELEALEAHRAAQQTRERDEWFALYLEYLEECILDADLDNKMRRRQATARYQIYREAIHHIERELCSRRDSLRGNVVWPDEMMDALKRASVFRSSRCSAEYECEACKRQNHMATYDAQLGGVACDANELYRENWMQRLRKSMFQAKSVSASFQMGSTCHARTLAYWQLLHAKHFWCILVDAKRKECGDATGRIGEQFRTAFHKQEFGRYKRLLNLVDTFETETRQSQPFMPNVWKKVTPQHVKSDFLPRRAQQQQQSSSSRRGTLDSFVAESEEEDNDDDEEEEEEEVEVKDNEVAIDDDDDDNEEPDAEQKDASVHIGTRSRAQEDKAPTSAAIPTALFKSESENSTSSTGAAKKAEESATEAEDLLCLVCGENPRNGAIMHGQYLHFYCCFRCGKRQFRSKMGCLVCDRPIDKVLRLLPLTAEARNAIKEGK